MSDTPPESNSAPSPSPVPAGAPAKRTGKPSLVEDLIVTGFGLITSTAVAWASWWMAAKWDMAVYTFMVNFIIPAGAVICGIVAATGYWIGARLFNHRPSRTLLFNIVLVSITTFFVIHHFHYDNDEVQGVPISKLMTYPEYLVAVTEHMSYSSSRGGGAPTELGKWGWGVAALQVIGFSIGGFVVYGWLCSVPYCDRCAKYLSEKKSHTVRWSDPEIMHASAPSVVTLMQEGRLQEAVSAHAALGEPKPKKPKAMLTLEMRKCPACENRRLRLMAMQHNGNQWAHVGETIVDTEQPVQIS
ncbi:hypothetical protein AYO49_04840 [Verrucomicrobiaceae bacterium SCGC AG-212-N21]|nr:hypothetical protein AYO49_04840 [Verrucomicrobiaceae bacterium SCGC AG-212-N21]